MEKKNKKKLFVNVGIPKSFHDWGVDILKRHTCPERKRCPHCGVFLPINGKGDHKHK